jgi:hypothetical protein
MSLMLSELIQAATNTYEDFGDMPVFIDREEDDYECLAIEMRREIDLQTRENTFVVADYVYESLKLAVVK